MDLNLTLLELQTKLSKQFYDMGKTIEVIYDCLKYEDNLILYGPGGYGKSTLVTAVLAELGLTQATVTGYEDMPVEGLIGMPNMKKLTEESTYETAFDKSPFATDDVLVLEEFLEVAPATMAVMKDILTAGGLRQGNKFHKSNIKVVIICTNKAPNDIMGDTVANSLIVERFPVHYKVLWDSFKASSYLKFIEHVLDKPVEECHKVLAELCARNETPVSPRTIKVCLTRIEDGLDKLQNLPGLDTSELEEVKVAFRRYSIRKIYQNFELEILKYTADLQAMDLNKIRQYNEAVLSLEAIIRRLNEFHIEDVEIGNIVQNVRKDVTGTLGYIKGSYAFTDMIDEERINNIFEPCLQI